MLNTSVNRHAPTTRTMALVVVSVLAMTVAIASFDAFAQSFGPGALTGHVYDASGGVLPGVEVTLTGGQQARRSAVSDGSGRFAFASVGPGAYSLEVELPGFRPLRNEFTLAAPADWTRNITLQVGQLEETIRVTAKRPAQAVPPTSTAASGPVRVGGNIKQPRKVKHENPIYPAAMQIAGLEGLVPMEALIGIDGSVVSVRVLSAEVHPEFARAAETAVRQWRFTPTMLNNRAVEVQVTVSVDFTLED
jgi:TonB family protein